MKPRSPLSAQQCEWRSTFSMALSPPPSHHPITGIRSHSEFDNTLKTPHCLQRTYTGEESKSRRVSRLTKLAE
ncbi:hypothetical protein E2C01_045469 [Portunus trituberculatus]|uniref:Uncharacterized protein n=1 Tax=Portunus trituberculatus TaxID=210409 RepID=A0A5B7G264_PORTR|nr:hypothetical protein [Portunus trituberculatus]